ncbi:sensitivity to red-light reduced protein [Entomortierella chlamydospora]|uniref:Sensitivity to red-light reduced protein n=1 Tax=Entomortierella chlamydospora TaxID=101097 RepID=A0A9P6T394_9FUNG|nr:sensitivity to red-light reduced protein [Entomortierella chlamydospora]
MSFIEVSPQDAEICPENKEVVEEPFVFVSRRKNGCKHGNSGAGNPSLQTLKTPKEIKGIMQNGNSDLPGWTSKKPGKIRKNSQRAKMLGLRGIDQEEKSIEWGMSMMEDRVMTLKQSKFYQTFQELVQLTLCPPCKIQEHTKNMTLSAPPSSINSAKVPLESSTKIEPEGSNVNELKNDGPVRDDSIKDMIFYGIGSIEASRNSQFQLALGLCLKEIIQVTGTISISDPIMTEFDKQLVEKLGLSVVEAEGKAKHQIKARTLLYMPHCPKGLYSRVLEANWSREKLNQLVILGNRFTMQVAKQAPFILPALSIANVSPLPQIKFEDNTIFNDLAIHSFPSERAIPEIDLVDRENDPECL